MHCTSCGDTITRDEIQIELKKLNPTLAHYLFLNPMQEPDVASSNPDGDVDIKFDFNEFVYPACKKCDGIIKPR